MTNRIATILKELNLSQREVAAVLFCSPSTVSRLATGVLKEQGYQTALLDLLVADRGAPHLHSSRFGDAVPSAPSREVV